MYSYLVRVSVAKDEEYSVRILRTGRTDQVISEDGGGLMKEDVGVLKLNGEKMREG